MAESTSTVRVHIDVPATVTSRTFFGKSEFIATASCPICDKKRKPSLVRRAWRNVALEALQKTLQVHIAKEHSAPKQE